MYIYIYNINIYIYTEGKKKTWRHVIPPHMHTSILKSRHTVNSQSKLTSNTLGTHQEHTRNTLGTH